MSNLLDTNLKKQYPLQNKDYELTELDDEIILFSVKFEKAIYLNSSAQLIWQLCDGKYSVNDIIADLQEQYPDESLIEQQVLEAFDKMLEDDVITFIVEPAE